MIDPLLRRLDADKSRETGECFLDLITAYLDETAAGIGSVSTRKTAEELAATFDETIPMDGHPLEAVLARIEQEVLPEVIRVNHPMYMGHQVSAPLPASIWIESLISAVNNSMAVQEMSPPSTIIEHQVMRWLGHMVGWGEGSSGTLTSGGTEATFTALLAARTRAIPNVWQEGIGMLPPVVVYGENSHYGIARAIGQLGIGLQNGICVPARDHRMDTAALIRILDRLISDGRKIMAVVATAGSTPTGSFDDLDTIGGYVAHVGRARVGASFLARRALPIS
jgi:L-2,4-diaminobutyrate decarboxylase